MTLYAFAILATRTIGGPLLRWSPQKMDRFDPISSGEWCYKINNWLVVWNMNVIFSIYWEFHHPNWRFFFRGVETTNQTRMGVCSVITSKSLCWSISDSRMGQLACVSWKMMIENWILGCPMFRYTQMHHMRCVQIASPAGHQVGCHGSSTAFTLKGHSYPFVASRQTSSMLCDVKNGGFLWG